ncbi:SDR family NAD(P)-dependent oxidoreductase [Jeotgalibacillus aurantiacus]|uniref:SDR family NAD(P)-dependent oxidoreductase n=1 Tax=Jeotgalibacillus aurantiacus TaxID=2763266 RepID=UPI001D09F573|nr:SDR family NAD(P)-dependent oxidoreductase [Jeotgalibacillus aurantiacus]
MAEKVMVIVGAGPGIGLSTAKKFGKEGYAIALVARNEDKLLEYVDELEELDIEAEAFHANAHSNESLKTAIHYAKEVYGRIDILMYNAYTFRQGPPSELDPNDLAADLQVDAVGALASVQAALPHLEEGSTILLTGGVLGVKPMKNFASVSVGKAAMRILAMTLHQELKSKGIYVGTLTINGFVKKDTHFSPDNIAERMYEMAQKRDGAEWNFDRE